MRPRITFVVDVSNQPSNITNDEQTLDIRYSMGTSKRRNAKPQPQLRSRTTRSKGKPLADPAENSQLLTEQLRAMGLYAAPTLGDGNCLFRALSDQLYGTPSYHLKLRQDICDWIESHKQRYEPFVDDERGLDVHLQCMRQPATYGGHLELSAFAHMMHRDVKVIQPGLVYVIEWATGGELADAAPSSVPSQSSAGSVVSAPDDSTMNDREKRRITRERRRVEREKAAATDANGDSNQDYPPGPIYVAYHDWEHFSSIRSLRGPHTGLPNVVETPAPEAQMLSPPSSRKPLSRTKSKPQPKTALKHPPKTRASVIAEAEAVTPQTPYQIPLPDSRSPSPVSSPAPALPAEPLLSHSVLPSGDIPRSYRSPKRTFDESSASSQAHSESSQSAAKRAKSSSRAPSRTRNGDVLPVVTLPTSGSLDMQVDEVDPDIDTPDLSLSGSSPESTSSLSSAPSPAATPPPPPVPIERRLTRRQRKALGLPKPRLALVAKATARTRSGVGKIVIPGGKYQKTTSKPTVQANDEEDEDTPDTSAEWRRNGTGRVDVRGFRELKI
ncbi:hypothetical protein AcV5_010071 [Taiwanofungus camphoratus]|nr:hypothetical protein AcV5_010071 [Antrodia cinnamomea]KAI0945978.1 hypothetical protein AcV7_010078 [Antrodia cinnamomea]